jgi:NAD(P)H-hydrate epimerase
MPRDGDVENLADFLRGRAAVVDAMFGTGLDREVKGLYRRAIEMINASRLPVYALDLPSGLDADTGLPLGACIRARHTITFAFLKRGLVVYPGAELAGRISVVDIGAPADIIDKVGYDGEIIGEDVLAEWLEPRGRDSHKGTYGHVLVVAGSRGRTGAALMASAGALRCGAGLVTIAAQDSVADTVDAAKPVEVMMDVFHPTSPDSLLGLLKGKTAVAFGPGVGLGAEMEHILERLVEACTVPLVIDADGLTLLARRPGMLEKASCPVILTPHPGEMVRLTGSTKDEINTFRIPVAREYASRTKTCLILKGARTVVADQGGRVFVNTTGNPGMATGGMGDVLTGMVASFCGQNHPPLESCCLSVFVHGRAGDLAARETGERALAASDLIDAVSTVLAELEKFNCPKEEKR